MKQAGIKLASVLALVAFAVAPMASASLVNPGFEDGNAMPNVDVGGAPGWGTFEFAFTTEQAARGGAGQQSLKLYGPFFPGGASGAFQSIPVSPGDTVAASVWGFDAGDADPDGLKGNNFGLMILQFFNGSNNIGEVLSPQINSSAPDQVWVELTASGVAPAGTTSAQILLLHIQANNPVTGGSVFFDDASLAVVAIPEPGAALALATLLPLAGRRRR